MDVDIDYLVIGSGLAGLTYALNVAANGTVALLTKKTRTDANSSWAQGGIAGVIADDDSFELHKRDTLIAGAGLCSEEAVDVLVREGPERIRDLILRGAQFDMKTDETGVAVLSLGREGGHSRNRIVHTADFTGWECERTLLEAVRAEPNITVHEHYFVTDLLIYDTPEGRVCGGAYALNSQTGEVVTFRAKATLLATGGSGQVYQHTTNPAVATGDGVAMAWRAGAKIANMEFVQFHPTTLYHPDARAFLITEALRGEGGILRHGDGEAFMERYHPLKDLAPRDIVARAIVSEMKRRDVPNVFLDATHIPAEKIKTHFPTVYEKCLSVGIDITKVPIPIVPAQHYQCGGVVTDLEGATDIARLYAAGEVACTGVHGANRLASNSLLEAMVFGYRAAKHTLCCANTIAASGEPVTQPPSMEYQRGYTLEADKVRNYEIWRNVHIEARETLDKLSRKIMQDNVGIVRTTEDLLVAQKLLSGLVFGRKVLETEDTIEDPKVLRIKAKLAEINERLGNLPPSRSGERMEGVPEYWESRNIRTVGYLIVESALQRHESRGLHYVLDYPEPVESERHDTILTPEFPQSNLS